MSSISLKLIEEISGVLPPKDLDIETLDLLDYQGPKRFLTFVESRKYVLKAMENPFLAACFCSDSVALALLEKGSSIVPLVVQDPRFCFFTLHNKLCELEPQDRKPSFIHRQAFIEDGAHISPFGVKIGKGSLVEAGAVVRSDTAIGENCIIRSGAVIGTWGFKYARTKEGIISVYQNRGTILENSVEVGGGGNINRGWANRDTVIKCGAKIDALVHIAHGVLVGERCLIGAHGVLAGNAVLGRDVWIGPGAVVSNGIKIGDGAYVTIGSCVVKDVPPGAKVTGYFAVDHWDFLASAAHLRRLGI